MIAVIGVCFICGCVNQSQSIPSKDQSLYICKDGQNCSKQNVTVISKDNLTAAQRKLSTDLLLAIGSGNNKENQLVYVYINTSEGADPAVINPYVSNITNSDPANHLFVAWMNINNLTALASLDSVQSIRTVTPPINR